MKQTKDKTQTNKNKTKTPDILSGFSQDQGLLLEKYLTFQLSHLIDCKDQTKGEIFVQ